MGKLTISMAIFSSYVKLPEGKHVSTMIIINHPVVWGWYIINYQLNMTQLSPNQRRPKAPPIWHLFPPFVPGQSHNRGVVGDDVRTDAVALHVSQHAHGFAPKSSTAWHRNWKPMPSEEENQGCFMVLETAGTPCFLKQQLTGWWCTYPSEKYESQLGLLLPAKKR